jgi:hypothetical protein
MFYGDHQASDKPRTFLRQFEEDLTELPHLSETEKCYRFYNYCRSGSDAEYWYEELERNSLKVLTCWLTLANHFRVKWLHGSPNLLLKSPENERTTVAQPNTATTVSLETTTTTTPIPAPVNTAAPAIYKTTTMPKRVDCMANACHIVATLVAPPTKLATTTTTTATATDANDTITIVPQQDNEEEREGREEEQRKITEKPEGVRE